MTLQNTLNDDSLTTTICVDDVSPSKPALDLEPIPIPADQSSSISVSDSSKQPEKIDSSSELEITHMFAKQNIHDVPTEVLNQMGADEREQALYDLHGVPGSLDDSPESIASKLAEMDAVLEQIPSETKGALEEALRQNQSYIHSLREAFLWADTLQPVLAAQRMVRHYEAKRHLFGSDKLGQELGLQDLTSEEQESFRDGYAQFLPQRDRAGRAIMMLYGKMQLNYPIEITTKLFFLMSCISLGDPEIVKKGVIFIYYGVGQDRLNDTTGLIQCLTFLPIRIVAIHKCYDDNPCHSGAAHASYTMMAQYLCRFQTHFGTHQECQHNLRTFGIPMDVLPIDAEGHLDCTHHHQWLAAIELLGSTSPALSDAEKLAPGPMDIIMGRGQRGIKSAGNQKLKRLLIQHHEAYEAAPRFEKLVVAQIVVKEMVESGSKFLSPTKDNKWVEASEDAIRSKIAQDFRNLRLTKKRPS
eukprot:Nitzschia sp. Nitz4//scaffold133_size116822//107007//108517//NITZ4_003826-RA/size116822-snap-gene-0.9-mRNA-1//1//CDS//3329535453//5262//frame0